MSDASLKEREVDPIELRPGTGLRLLVDDTVYAIDAVHPLEHGHSVCENSDDASDIELRPYAGEGRVRGGSDVPVAELQLVSPDHTDAVAVVEDDLPSPDENVAMFERDLVTRQLKLQQANLKVIQMALNENRPLEALYTVNGALDELDDVVEAIDDE